MAALANVRLGFEIHRLAKTSCWLFYFKSILS